MDEYSFSVVLKFSQCTISSNSGRLMDNCVPWFDFSHCFVGPNLLN